MKPEPQDKYCLSCGYNLRDLERSICPECGAGFDPADVTTWAPHPPAAVTLKAVRQVGMGCFIGCGGIVMGVIIILVLGVFAFVLNWIFDALLS